MLRQHIHTATVFRTKKRSVNVLGPLWVLISMTPCCSWYNWVIFASLSRNIIIFCSIVGDVNDCDV